MSNFLQTRRRKRERQGNTEEKEDGSQKEKPDCADPSLQKSRAWGVAPSSQRAGSCRHGGHQQHLSEPEIGTGLAQV